MSAADLPSHDRWRALSIDAARMVFNACGAPWWIAGGRAVDLFLGGPARDHGDIDISMLRGDHRALGRLSGLFDLYVAHGGELTRWDGAALAEGRHQLWARYKDDDAWAFEVLLERHRGAAWVYRRDPRITLPIGRFGRTSADGTPFVAPEVALLYKATAHGLPRNAADFARVLPRLEADARRWLRDALRVAHPSHPWIPMLDDGTPSMPAPQ